MWKGHLYRAKGENCVKQRKNDGYRENNEGERMELAAEINGKKVSYRRT